MIEQDIRAIYEGTYKLAEKYTDYNNTERTWKQLASLVQGGLTCLVLENSGKIPSKKLSRLKGLCDSINTEYFEKFNLLRGKQLKEALSKKFKKRK